MKKNELLSRLFQKSTWRIRALVAFLVLLVGIAFFAFYFWVVSPGSAKAYNGDGTGTYDDPYLVTNCEELQQVFGNYWFVQMNDIDCYDTRLWNGSAGFNPLVLSGVYDGRGYEIRDLFIDRPTSDSVGLFSLVEANGIVKNVHLTKQRSGAQEIDMFGNNTVGSAVAEFRGDKIVNVHSQLNVKVRSIDQNNNGSRSYLGGLVGLLRGSVNYSSYTGRIEIERNGVTGRFMHVGGLAGLMEYDPIANTYGSTPRPEASVTNSFSAANIDAIDTTNQPIIDCGGLIGTLSHIHSVQRFSVQYSYSTSSQYCPAGGSSSSGGLIGVVSVGDEAVDPTFTSNFAAGLTNSNTGLVGGYAGNTDSSVLESNAIDATLTGTESCGQYLCMVKNISNTEPGYFQDTDNDFYTSWDFNAVWESTDAFPKLRERSVRSDAPSNVSFVRSGSDLTISWINPSNVGARSQNISGYQLWYAPKIENISGGDWVVIQGNLESDEQSYTFTDLTLPGDYSFKIRSVFTEDEQSLFGLFSETVQLNSQIIYQAPDNITITAGATAAGITWDSVDAAEMYEIEYRLSSSEGWQSASSVNSINRTAGLLDLSPMQDYELRIRGKKGIVYGPWSEIQQFSTKSQTRYEVSNCQQLMNVSNDVEGIYTQTANINCLGVDFEPIAYGSIFMGEYNGNGYKIRYLSISKEAERDELEFRGVGLFSFAFNAKITNVIIENSSVSATYTLPPEDDADQDGLPDLPTIDVPSIVVPQQIPENKEELINQAIASGMSIKDAYAQLLDQVYQPTLPQQQYSKLAKVSSGGVIGIAGGSGQYDNLHFKNSIVRGGVAGGVIGLVLPFRSFGSLLNASNPSAVSVGEPLTMSGLQSSGLVSGHVAGGLIGAGLTSLASAARADGSLTILNSTSQSEVSGSIAGGIVGIGASTAGVNILTTILMASTQPGGISTTGEALQPIVDSLQYATNTHDFIIQNSTSSGLVSACNAESGIRMALLGGVVGFGLGTHIDATSSSGRVENCSQTTSNWGIYGGAMGGIGGMLVTSRVTNSSSSGAILAQNNDTPDQTTVLNSYIGAIGGAIGFNFTSVDDSNGLYAIDNVSSSGSITAESKTTFFGSSGGLIGVQIGNGTLRNSRATGNVTHRLPEGYIGGSSIAGGLTGLTIGFDVPFTYSYATVYPGPPFKTHGFDILDSYATGNVTVDKVSKGGHLTVGGGLSGLIIGQSYIHNAHATGNVTGGSTDTVLIDGIGEPDKAILKKSEYGTAVSGGLIGAAFGVDVTAAFSTAMNYIVGFGGDPVTSQAIQLFDVYATGSVDGNLAGGLIGSADLKIDIQKAYASGDVRGAIAGGLIGQAGLLESSIDLAATWSTYVMAFVQSLIPSSQPDGPDQGWTEDEEILIRAIASAINQGKDAITPISLLNTYARGNVTGTPRLATFSGGLFLPSLSPISPINLPSSVGGLIGLYMVPGGQVKNSYAAGNVTVAPDLSLGETNESAKLSIGKVPSAAGGVFGTYVSISSLSITNVAELLINLGAPQNTADYLAGARRSEIENVFAAPNVQLQSSSLSGNGIGLLIEPAKYLDALVYVNSDDTSGSDNVLYTNDLFIDKAKTVGNNCNGPNKSAEALVRPFIESTSVDTSNAENMPLSNIFEILASDAEFDAKFNELLPSEKRTAFDQVLQEQQPCTYIDSRVQQKYFINNNVNAPLNEWNFDTVWKVIKDDYPRFVAGAADDTPTPTGGGTPVVPAASSTKTVRITDLPQETRQKITTTTSNVTKTALAKLGFGRTPEEVKGLKAILARVPVFLARSIPYSILLLLLILAAMYSYQALREYRQLKKFHLLIMRIVATKESVDNFLAITTHYLNTPAAIMGGAVELLQSMKKITANRAASLTAKIRRYSDAAAALTSANQVSNAQAANDQQLLRHDQPNPLKAKAVWVPAVIALGLLTLANVLFVYADVFNRSPYRIVVEFLLYGLGVLLLALAYKYRNFMTQTKLVAEKQLAMEVQLYQKRTAFVPEAANVIKDNFEDLQVASEPLKNIAEAKLFINGLSMLEGISLALSNVMKFSDFQADMPLFDVSTYAQKAVDRFQDQAKVRSITLKSKVDSGLVGHMQPEAARQLIDSLIDNAVTFSKDGGQVEVKVYRRFTKLIISVSDNGVGISASKLPSLLKPFSRGTDSMQYNYEGLGLGLYTDKIITDKLGGVLEIKSKLGQGTVATITIPFNHDATEVAPQLVMPEVPVSQ